MVQFSFRPPGADYLGFEATPEGISETACKAEELGFDAVLRIYARPVPNEDDRMCQ